MRQLACLTQILTTTKSWVFTYPYFCRETSEMEAMVTKEIRVVLKTPLQSQWRFLFDQ